VLRNFWCAFREILREKEERMEREEKDGFPGIELLALIYLFPF